MDKRCSNRLTVLGSKEKIQGFLKSRWDRRLRARYCEWMENFPRRVVCLYETDEPPLEPLRKLSRRWPQLVFLLDWEWEDRRFKGLVNAKAGLLHSLQTEY
jgi:hypothetical protein